MSVMKMQQVQLEGAVEAIRVDSSGHTVAAITELGALSFFDCSKELRRIGGTATGLQACDLEFSPDGSLLVVTGVRQREAVEGAVLVYSVPPGDAPPITVAVFDTMASAPTFLPLAPPVLVVGAYLRLVCFDGGTFAELGSAEGDDYVALRGVVALAGGKGCAAVWGRQGFSRLNWYSLDPPSQPVLLDQAEKEPEPLGGIALSPSGSRIAASFARTDELRLSDAKVTEGPYGHVSLYDTTTRTLVAKHELPGSLERDFTNYGGSRGKRKFGAEKPPTRPVYLDESHVAVGMPGGDVRVLDTETGVATTGWQIDAGIASLDFSPRAGVLTAGGPTGAVCVWKP
jgi:hypothetical protein